MNQSIRDMQTARSSPIEQDLWAGELYHYVSRQITPPTQIRGRGTRLIQFVALWLGIR
jgi:hypothetical protein